MARNREPAPLLRTRFLLDPLGTLDRHAGDPARAIDMGRSRVLVWDPEQLGRLFAADADLIHAPSATLQPIVGERSLLFTDGSRHISYRKALAPRLRGPELAGVVSETIDAAVEALRTHPVIDLATWTRQLTLDAFATILLGRADRELVGAFAAWIDRAIGTRPRVLAFRYLRPHTMVPSPWRRFLRERRDLDRRILRAAREAPMDGEPRPLVAALTAPLDDDELRDQLASLLFAGHETTASAIAWALYWLEREDHARAAVEAELASTPGSGADAATFPVLDAVARETLRITPPAVVAGHRRGLNSGAILGRPITPDVTLTPCIYLAHRRPDVYPEPERFDHTRFLGQRRPRTDYLPFGSGVRHCLGSELALLEMRMVVAAVHRHCVLRRTESAVVRRQMRGPAMAPATGLTMRAEMRAPLTNW